MLLTHRQTDKVWQNITSLVYDASLYSIINTFALMPANCFGLLVTLAYLTKYYWFGGVY